VNQAWLSGNVSGSINFGQTGDGTEACSFSVASDRTRADNTITAWVRCNVYGDLVRICKSKLDKGVYVSIVGELMNRDAGNAKELLEIRVNEIVFFPRQKSDHG